MLQMLERTFEIGAPPDYEPDPATSIAARARAESRSPWPSRSTSWSPIAAGPFSTTRSRTTTAAASTRCARCCSTPTPCWGWAMRGRTWP